MSNARQLATANYMYTQDYDETILPSTNYAVPSSDPLRIWPAMVQPYVRNHGVFLCPSASGARFAENWSMRGYAPIGYNALSGYDPAGIEAPTSVAALATLDEAARTVLLGDTPNGPTSAKYRGYVFDPVNGLQNAVDPRLSTPLTADRDLVAESPLAPAQLKPLYCRHFADGQNHGTASLVLADGHARSYSAAAILAQGGGAALIWRFR